MEYDFNKSSYPQEQVTYAARVRAILEERGVNSPKATVVTYGCQQNVSDSQKIRGMLSLIGYEFTEDTSKADLIIFNTCAVREHAEDRVYGNVGGVKKFKEQNKNLIIAVCGCMAQQEKVKERFKKSYPYVDIVFGTQVSHRLPEFIYKRYTGGRRIFESEMSNDPIIEDVPIDRDGKIKGFLPIMYGCDNFCSYCIVPYVRGRERSRDSAEIIKEAKRMVAAGYKEIMLLGQNVNSYGKGLNQDINFAKLLKMINDIEGDFIIRFMSSHPKDCTEELLETMAQCEKVERHFHLPVQCGSDRVLKIMNRRYTAEKYLSFVEKARELMPDITFTSDIIVGFPGETYEDFKLTLDLVKRVKYSALFTFIYSPREGTPAAQMPDPVSREEKGKWFNELLILQDKITKDYVDTLMGKTFRVLADAISDNGVLSGRTSGGLNVNFEGSEDLLGNFVNVKINGYNGTLLGVIE